MNDGEPVSEQFIDAKVSCIALSPDDKFVALGSASGVWIYEVGNSALRHQELPPMTPPNLESQRVCFSADSEKIILATRNTAGDVYTYLIECTRDGQDHHKFP